MGGLYLRSPGERTVVLKPDLFFAALAFSIALAAAVFAPAQDVQITSGDGQAVVVTSDGSSPVVVSGPLSPSSGPAEAKPEDGEERPGENEKKDEAEKPKEEADKEKSTGAKEEEKAKTPEPVVRPSEPPKPPDPEELKIRPDADGKIRFNFNGQPWQGVLEWLADVSGMSLDWQELPGDYLNLTTQRGYTLDETRDLISRHLLARGYTLLRYEEVLSVVKLEKLNPGMVPRVEPEDLDRRDPYEFVKVSFPLDWMIAGTAVDELKPMLSPFGKLNPLAATNRIEAMDAVVNLREIRDLLVIEQSPEAEERLFEEFPLQYAKAADVQEQLMGLLGIESKSKPSAPMSPQQIQQMQQMQEQARQQAQQQQQKGGPQPKKEEPPVNLVVNPRRNSILVQAPPDKMAIIRQAVEALDVPAGPEESLLLSMHRMQIYRLAAIDPEPLVKTLEALGDLDPKTRLEVDKVNRAIIAYAPAVDHVMIRALVDQLDGSGRRFEVIPLRRLEADYVAGTIQFMMAGEEQKEDSRSSRYYFGYGYSSSRNQGDQQQDKFRVDADVEHNRLLLWANDIEVEEVQSLLVKLGEIPPEGGNMARIRVLEGTWGPETGEWLDRVRRAWPSVAPNPLELPAEEPDEAEPMDDGTPRAEAAEKSARADRAKEHPVILLAQLSQSEPTAGGSDSSPGGPGSSAIGEPKAEEVSPTPPAAGAATMDERSGPPGHNQPNSEDPAPIQITRGPDGRIVISSEDTRALDLLEDLMTQLAPARIDYKIFRLKYAWAYGVALTLEDVFKEDEKETGNRYPWYWYGNDWGGEGDQGVRLSKRRPLKFISDPDTNSILVQNADPTQLAKIEELIKFYDQPEPVDSQSVRKMKIFQLRYAKATTVVEAVKDVYRDLLSANDKALARSGEQQSSQRTVYYYDVFGSSDEETQQQAPRFKGLLSIGFNELSNTVAVSAPSFILEDVSQLVESLDEAAKPTAETVELLHVGPGVDISQVREKLDKLMGQGGGRDKREQPARDETKPPDRRPQGSQTP
jgi:type II secretory pathway component GspD/PulD (secretin)